MNNSHPPPVSPYNRLHPGRRLYSSHSTDPEQDPCFENGPNHKPRDLSKCHPSLTNPNVPAFVDFCAAMIEKHGMDFVGLYRVPGNNAAVSSLEKRFHTIQSTYDVAIKAATTDGTSRCDVAAYTSAMKQFFRNLPDPLINSEIYDSLMAANKLNANKERMMTLKKLLQKMPPWHYETLHYMVRHLNMLASNSDKNKMDRQNLAIVFGPTLMRRTSPSSDNFLKKLTPTTHKKFVSNSPHDITSFAADTLHQCSIIQTFLNHSEWFFDHDVSSNHIPDDSANAPSCSQNSGLHLVFDRLNTSLSISQAKSCDEEPQLMASNSLSSSEMNAPTMTYLVKSAPNIPAQVAEEELEQTRASCSRANADDCPSGPKCKSRFGRKLKLVRNMFRKTLSITDSKQRKATEQLVSSSLSVHSNNSGKLNSLDRNSPPMSANDITTASSPSSSLPLKFFPGGASSSQDLSPTGLESRSLSSSVTSNSNAAANIRKSGAFLLTVPVQ